MRFLTSGYAADIDEMLNGALFSVDYSEMVIVRDIDFYSMCEHHLLPFFGKCHVAYIPNGRVIGLSKIPRLVDIFARRLQLQERLTNQIAHTILDKIQPLGVAWSSKGRTCAWRCAASRSRTPTRSRAPCSERSAIKQRTRMEFLELLKLRSGSLSITGLPLPRAHITSTNRPSETSGAQELPDRPTGPVRSGTPR